jgi:glycosyltransferase involved in cell wall biosynthesis
MRILFALAGLHRVNRGAEVAFTSIGSELANAGHQVTLLGSGPTIAGRPYEYLRAACVPRERFEKFPKFPFLRQETAWEELTFVPGLLARYHPGKYDVTLTCGFPFTNLALRRPALGGGGPKHIFVTQNGDWPAYSRKSEYRLFGCDGLICTNPDYFERNRASYRCALIPNGVDLARFSPGAQARERFELDPSRPVVLMVSALIVSKHVDVAIDTVSQIPDAILVVAGDGPLRYQLAEQAEAKLRGRYRQVHVSPAEMPDLYRSADVFLHLSQDESFGNVFVEALASGLPIVAWDLPRTRWIVGNSPLLASPGDPEDLRQRIEAALATGAASSTEALQRASRFSWKNVAALYGEFIEQVIGNEGYSSR